MLSDRMKEVISTLGIKKGEFANRIGYAQSYISMIMSNAKNNPSDRFFFNVNKEFNIDIKWFKTGEGNMYSEERYCHLSEDERRLMIKYMRLPVKEQQIVDEIIDALLYRNGN